jgi:hypothetical protein
VRAALPLLLLLLPALCFAEPATVIHATELKQAPATDAATLAPLAESETVEALERKGGWTRVKSAAGAEGWVRMLMLRYTGGGEARQGESGVAQLMRAARTGTSGTQVATGVRGLDAALLANARPDAAQLKKLQGYAATRDAAAGFAASGRLEARRVDYPKEGG